MNYQTDLPGRLKSSSSESLPGKLAAALTGQIGLMVIGILTTMILARVLGPTGKGLFTLCLTAASSIVIIAHGSLAAGSAYYGGRHPETRPGLVGNGLAMSFLWGGALTAVCGLLLQGNWIQRFAALDPRLWWMAVFAIIPLLLIEYAGGMVIGFDAIRSFSLTLLTRELLLLVGLLILIKLQAASAYTSVAVWVVATVLGSIMMLSHALRRLEAPPRIEPEVFKKISLISIQGHAANLFGTLKLRFDPLMLAWFLAPADVGYYSIATAMVAGLWYLPSAISQVLLPLVSGRGDVEGNRLTPVIVRIGFAGVVLGAIGLALLGKILIIWLPGANYLPALPALLVLIPGAVIYSLAKMLSGDLMGRGKPMYGMIISTAAFFANIVAGVLLIPRFGIIGAAAASSVTHAFTGLMFLYYFLHESGMPASQVLIPQWGDLQLILRKESLPR